MLKIKLETLRHELKTKISESLKWKDLELEGNFYPYSRPIQVEAEAEFSNGRIYVHGTVKTGIIHPCDRCLEPVDISINGKIEFFYLPKESKRSEEDFSTDAGTSYYDPHDDFIDLEDNVLGTIVLEIPMKVLCKPDCKGLCPHCGTNLNEHPDHVCKDEADQNEKKSPFYILKGKDIS